MAKLRVEEHTVRQGETYWSIAKQYGIDPQLWPVIAGWNVERLSAKRNAPGEVRVDSLKPGEKLTIYTNAPKIIYSEPSTL
jgi:nucleoid-associated protein YgaU